MQVVHYLNLICRKELPFSQSADVCSFRWRDDDNRSSEIDVKASKRRRASPDFEPRFKPPPTRSPSMSPPFLREPLLHRWAFASLFASTAFSIACQHIIIIDNTASIAA